MQNLTNLLPLSPEQLAAQKEQKEARDKHIIENTEKGRFQALVKDMSVDSDAFQHWQSANEKVKNVMDSTSAKGTDPDDTRTQALTEARLARIAYLAPLDIASADARTRAQTPPLLTKEEWIEFACHQDASLLENASKTDKEFLKVIDDAVAALKKTYEDKYKDLLTPDQCTRATNEVQKRRGTLVDMMKGFVGARIRSDVEKQLYDKDRSTEEAKKAIDQKRIDDVTLTLLKDPSFRKLSQSEQDKKINEAVEKEKKALSPEDAEKNLNAQIEEIERQKDIIRTELSYAQKAYSTNVGDITIGMEIGLQTLNMFQADINEFNKENPNQAIKVDENDTVSGAVKAATLELEKASIADFHHYARLSEARYTQAGKMGAYAADVAAKQHEVSKEQGEALGKIGDNEARKKEGKAMCVNGIPCDRVGSVEMYGIDLGSKILGYTLREGNVGKFFEAWMVETAKANNTAYQKENPGQTLSVTQMLTAYASGPTIPGPPEKPNENFQNGSPVNMLRITSFPVRHGVDWTMRAFAEMKAMAEILGIAIHIDIDAIIHNSKSEEQTLAKRVKYEMLSHLAPHDPTYSVPGMTSVRAQYGLDGLSPEAQKAILIQRLTGNAQGSLMAGVTATADKRVAGMTATGSTSRNTSASGAQLTFNTGMTPSHTPTSGIGGPAVPGAELTPNATPSAPLPSPQLTLSTTPKTNVKR